MKRFQADENDISSFKLRMRIIEDTFKSNQKEYKSLDQNFKEIRQYLNDAIKDTQDRGEAS